MIHSIAPIFRSPGPGWFVDVTATAELRMKTQWRNLLPSGVRSTYRAVLFFTFFVLAAYASALPAEVNPNAGSELKNLAWSTDSVGPQRFVSVHGRRAAMFGYSQNGLECWAYPFQIVSSLKVTFRRQGTTAEMDGQSILRRIVYSPESVTRIYAGPDFIVKERLFVPIDEPGAIVHYDVASSHPLDIVIRFIPVLDLMWPGGIGGQEAAWNSHASGYVISEPLHRFSGIIASPDIVEHDETRNENRRVGREPGLAFTMRAGAEHPFVRFVIAGGPEQSSTTIAEKLLQQEDSLIAAAVDHYSAFLRSTLQIETPDEDVNRALEWSEVALDQAWVCNPDLGCGLVAGYGPSRNARRPQYDWFFAGDGMVNLPALLASGQFEHAREELEFILKYQDPKNGMIWHELSQSAGWLDWRKYPYMFVHVELTFDFLSAVANYFSATGDRNFLQAHWSAIESAYNYCRSLTDPHDGLPRIPPEKEGSREQEALNEELALSASWVTGLQSYEELAAAMGHTEAAHQAAATRERIIPTISKRYWDSRQNFWITGYTRSGVPLSDRQIGPVSLLGGDLFSPDQRNSILQQLASSDFRTDWGVRGRSAISSTYDPNSYANGSVWATGTSSAAVGFWTAHQPATALSIWSSLVPWSSLDSLGHMHETLAGDYFHEEFESVPEQTWSSAKFFEAAVNGMLGLQVDAIANRLTFAPHVPPNWNRLSIGNIHVGSSIVSFTLINSSSELQLQSHNEGAPTNVLFAPEIPLGANLRSARLNGRPIICNVEAHPQDAHAKVEFNLPRGDATLSIGYSAGVALLPQESSPKIGNSSEAIKITRVNLQGSTYTVQFEYLPSMASSFQLRTRWPIKDVQGANFERTSSDWYRLTVTASAQNKNSRGGYQKGQVKVNFSDETSAR